MSKEKFQRDKPQRKRRHDWPRDHGKTTLTAVVDEGVAETTVAYMAYDQIDKAPEEKARGITISRARGVPVEEPALRARGLPGHATM